MINTRRCLECSGLLNGRADQKFCGDQCRSAYNNKNSFEHNTLIHSVNRILKKNHSILSAFQSMGKTSITRAELQKKGYRFDFYTSMSISRNNKLNYFCYDRGYRELEHHKLVLIECVVDDDQEMHLQKMPETDTKKNDTPVLKNVRLKGAPGVSVAQKSFEKSKISGLGKASKINP